MADINSLINPPEETKESLDYKDESEEANEPAHAAADPAVSQDTILSSFDRIKTHFPAARIKTIMQSDEDIGKVAQATPVVVGRALEIFMANLVEAAILETKGAGVRRIAASHVRAAVEKTEQFDFLVDVVLKYPATKN
ncbi:histone-fold-containing protein [Metschnikowia bicuspidata var. bicuspidata NRRL YB-4993]|uniref:Histone-fold-containing protein n=1 Tax=Metschnikowia bicuspidata var. bicuspidata NRRL YB-4993 TaxID=869754 RepID=A0A1A0HJD5_9ASCO|nr:histone-fold-containing protein [Metschnikowia bicuspidata var. bicuspidata NRRL YB-4993]OBA24269.1 histone-fold-containing protein [Metschnikowia bicuspidata var. bicuspidata NRRL YB-4993]